MNVGLVYDLSVRGARVCTEAPFKPGDEVTLSLRLPKQIRSADIAVATVRWPSGRVQELKDLALDVCHRIVEPE